MNIQRFILPASIAAALHVALLLALPREPYVVRTEVPLKPVSLPDLPPKETVVPPPETKNETEQPVKQLASAPTPPDLEPPPVLTELRNPFEVTEPEPRHDLDRVIRIIPAIFRPGEDGPTGPGDMDGSLGICSIGELDRVPNAKVQMAPDYPVTLQSSGVQGSVTVQFDVDATGRVTDARVVRSSHREFEATTLRAVLKWRFEPGKRRGRAVPFRLVVPVDFHLDRI